MKKLQMIKFNLFFGGNRATADAAFKLTNAE